MLLEQENPDLGKDGGNWVGLSRDKCTPPQLTVIHKDSCQSSKQALSVEALKGHSHKRQFTSCVY